MKKIFAFLMVLVTLVGLVACGDSDGSGGKRKSRTLESAVDAYYEAIYFGEMNNIEKTAPKQFWDWVSKEHPQTVEEIEEAYYEFDYLEINIGSNKKYYGDDLEITYEIVEKKELDADDCEKAHTDLENEYDTTFDEIEEMYRVKVEVVYSGSEHTSSKTFTHYACKIGTSWYLCQKGDNYWFTAVEFVDFSK